MQNCVCSEHWLIFVKNQAVAQKLVMDRLLPISTFEKKFDNRESITIRVSVIDKAPEAMEGEVIEQSSDDTSIC